MSDLTGQEIKETYKDLLHMNNGNTGVTSDLSRVFDGEGTGSSLYLSDTEALVMGDFGVHGSHDTELTPLILRNASNQTAKVNIELQVAGQEGRIGMHRPTLSSGSELFFSSNDSDGNLQERMRIDSTGRCGIGTTSPSAKLQVVETSSGTQFEVKGTEVIGGQFQINNAGGDIYSNYRGAGSNDDVVKIHTNGNSFFNGGNVGIGTAFPQVPLEIKGERPAIRLNDDDPASQSNFEIVNNGGAFAIFDAANNGLGNLLTINGGGVASGAGNVGIGTSTPSQPLEIKAAEGQFGCHVVDNQGASYGGLYVQNNGGTGSGLALYLKEPAGQTKARISADSANPSYVQGQFGIGTYSPIFALDVQNHSSITLGADTNNQRPTNKHKSSRVGGVHYDNAKNPVNMMMHYCSETENDLYFGWGTSAMVCPTKIVFGTASNTNTLSSASTSNQRMVIDGSGQVGIGTTAPKQKLFLKDGHFGMDGTGYIIQRGTVNTTGEYGIIQRTGYYQESTGTHYGRVRINTSYNASTNAADLRFYTAPSGNDNAAGRLVLTIGSTGTVACQYGLEVQGNISAGSASSAVKNFKIDHPLPEKSETHDLYHVSIEGPTADLIYRGVTKLENGIAEINIDSASRMTEGTFEALCTNVQCFTTNETSWDLTRGKVTGNILKIECQDPNCTDEISWMVIGERKDKSMLEHERTDDNGRLVPEWEKPEPEPEPEYEMIEPEEVVTEEPVAEEAPVEEQVSIGASISGESLTEVSDARAEEL